MFLFVEYIVEQKEWDRKFGLVIIRWVIKKLELYGALDFQKIEFQNRNIHLNNLKTEKIDFQNRDVHLNSLKMDTNCCIV